jgi:hypothetical protein
MYRHFRTSGAVLVTSAFLLPAPAFDVGLDNVRVVAVPEP